jgi:hypothetical protein
MKLSSYSTQARQARSRMQRLSSDAAYAQMDRLMGKKTISPARSANGVLSSTGHAPLAKSSR